MDSSLGLPIKLKALRWLGRQTWIPRGHDALLRMACNPDKCKPYSFNVDFFGRRYAGDLAASFIDWSVFMYGSYSYNELSLLEEIAHEMKRERRTITYYDIGANVGHHTLFMARLADQIFAFEPFAPVRKLIESKISLNKLNNVEVFPFALGSVEDELSFFPGRGRNTGTGTLVGGHGGGFANPVTVPVRVGDSVCEQRSLPPLDIVKIDVEGFEPFVLRGLSRRIRQDRPVILTEFGEISRRGLDSEEDFAKLFYEGAIFAEVGGRNGHRFELRPFNYATSEEVLIVPPEWAGFVRSRSAS
jgi:FkbM family methyltransferase